jgi:hypothetical protein
LYEEVLVDSDVEFVVEAPPVYAVLGDLYVCAYCGSPLTEIPAYNRYYCENCGLHY